MKQLFFYWRLLATAFSFLLFAMGALFLAIVLSPLIRLAPFSPQKRCAITRKAIQKSSWLYVRIMRALGLLNFSFEGLEDLDRPGILVIANHPTLLDAIFLMSVMPQTTFIVKAAMARHPVTRWLVNMAGYIPNDEVGVDLLEKAAAALKSGQQLMIFPEGTRTGDDGIQFKRGAANIALAASCPIVPVLIDCQPMTLRKCEKWYQLPETPPYFYFKVLPEIHPASIDQQQAVGIQARQLTRLMQSRILDRLQPEA